MTTLRWSSVALALCALTSCDSSSGTDAGPSGSDAGPCGAPAVGSCDLTSPEHVCTDYDGGGDWVAMAETSCAAMGGTWSSTPCSRASSLGGCRSTSSSCGTTIGWYYEGGSVADAASLMTLCNTSVPDSYVAP